MGVISDLNESSFHNDGSTRKGEALEGLLVRERERERENLIEQVWVRCVCGGQGVGVGGQ